jgi:hypothetical protein
MFSIPPHQDKIGLIQSVPILEPWHTIGMDIVGPLPTSANGNKYIFTLMDYMTKWPDAFAIPDQKTETLAKIFVEEVCCRHGIPAKIITDMGSNFMSGFFKDILFAYRTSVQTSANTSPFLLTYGREPRLPIDIVFEDKSEEKIYSPEDYRKKIVDFSSEARELALDSIQKSQFKSKHVADQEKYPVPNFRKGDLILLKQEGMISKMDKPWTGPYIIKDIEAYGNFINITSKGC